MGDLVIGARSGVGEPEDSSGRTVGSVDDKARGEAAEEKSEAAEKMGDQAGSSTPDLSKEDGLRGATGLGAGGGGGHDDLDDDLDGGAGASGASGAARTATSKKAAKKQRSFWKELPILVVVALALALLIKTFLVQAFSIPSGSMENTLQIGDRVLVDKLTPNFGAKPSRGEVVVFHDPSDWLAGEPGQQQSSNGFVRGFQDVLSWIGLMPSVNEKDLIKRVIAVGGDTISCKGTGPVFVNGKPLNEPYLYPGSTACGDKNIPTFKVPADSIYVMGDHRQDSLDSRYHADEPGGGSVPDKDVVGRAIVVAWPISHWKTLPIPDTFSQPGINNQALAFGAGHPGFVGLAAAVPLTWLNRRRKLRQK
ncbi:signal peptidase I [Streptacidiphilus jiangxiensis]|uniref:Signal peptidase I n=1 Tax=Streptacidiphilus jiangxiensis TaxID=235985 RepID=A0A1H7XVD4_STRJI|nr:signal peptidase I [Streptacidiphilus jiangxiensis]SEM37691.1 signal peptidase I [Streptacidiphilus jiangxiensis]